MRLLIILASCAMLFGCEPENKPTPAPVPPQPASVVETTPSAPASPAPVVEPPAKPKPVAPADYTPGIKVECTKTGNPSIDAWKTEVKGCASLR